MALDYPFLSISDALISKPLSPSTTDATNLSSSNIVSSSLFISEGLDACPISHPAPQLHGWTCSEYIAAPPNVIYSSPPPHLQLSTPDSSPQMFPCYGPPPSLTCDPVTSAAQQLHPPLPPVKDFFFCGSSLEESPISSPGDLEREINNCTNAVPAGEQHQRRTFSASPRPPFVISNPNLTSFDSCSSSEDDIAHSSHTDCPSKPVPDGIKMPQRKGGMQLWQFLYSMLTDKEGKYRNLIEWTHSAKERQFRLLEPDAIAVWWGHHKNKPNMSYDKLSRSLRYYYDKGIIRKINGERFVYRFCIDPEVMYKHMGTSNARPQLKPMPQDAKVAINNEHSIATASPCVAVEPEALPLSVGSTVEHVPTNFPPLFLPPTTEFNNSLSIPSTSTLNFTVPHVGSTMRRCHSYDSSCRPSNPSPIQQTHSASSFDGFSSLYTFGSAPTNYSNTPSPNTNSPPQSATLENYHTFSKQSSEYPQPVHDYYSNFPPPPLIPGPPFTSAY